MEREPYVTIDEVCEYFAVKKQWVYDQVEQRDMPVRRLGTRMLRFRLSDIERWMDERISAASR